MTTPDINILASKVFTARLKKENVGTKTDFDD